MALALLVLAYALATDELVRWFAFGAVVCFSVAERVNAKRWERIAEDWGELVERWAEMRRRREVLIAKAMREIEKEWERKP